MPSDQHVLATSRAPAVAPAPVAGDRQLDTLIERLIGVPPEPGAVHVTVAGSRRRVRIVAGPIEAFAANFELRLGPCEVQVVRRAGGDGGGPRDRVCRRVPLPAPLRLDGMTSWVSGGCYGLDIALLEEPAPEPQPTRLRLASPTR